MKRAGRMAAGNRTRKQFSFDLVQERLRKHYSSTSPANAYTELRNFLESNGFRHIEGSVYESEKVLSRYRFDDLMRKLMKRFPWFGKCVGSCHVADVSSPHDITQRFRNHVREQERADGHEKDGNGTKDIKAAGGPYTGSWGKRTGAIYLKALAGTSRKKDSLKVGKGISK